MTSTHPMIVKTRLIIDDFDKQREIDPLTCGLFYSKCALAISKSIIRKSKEGMGGMEVREVFNLINHILMMTRTQQLRISLSRIEALKNDQRRV